VTVTRRRFTVLATLLVAINIFFWLAQSGFALPVTGILQSILGSGRVIRADIVWQSTTGIEETRIDRGAIMSVTPEQVVLRERDGMVQTIPLATTVTVQFGLRTGTASQLRRGMRVIVSRPATGAATTVQVEGFGQ
jgi:hypothetical protein